MQQPLYLTRPETSPKRQEFRGARRSALVLAMLTVAACGSSKEQTKEGESGGPTRPTISSDPVQEERSSSAVIERIDVNGDMKPDVFKYYALVDQAGGDGKGAKVQLKALVRKEIDVNFDQRIDIVEYYKGEPNKEVKEREEYDLDFDGRVDEVRRYEDGTLKEVQLDLGFDGRIDTWMFYQMTKNEDGKDVNRLYERRRDQNGDGNIDVWEYYVKGQLQKLGTDSNGDGTPDQFTRVDEKR